MARDYTIEVCADTKCAEQGLENVEKSAKDAGKAIDTTSKKAQQGEKAAGKVGKAVKGIGAALAVAFGGVLLKALDLIFDLFQKNQRVVDFFAATVTTIEILFAKFSETIAPLEDALTGLFNNPKQAIIDFGNAIQTYVINYFTQIFEGIKGLGSAFLKLFTGDFTGALETAGDALLNFGDALLGSEGATEGLIEVIGDAVVEANNLVKATNDLKLAEAELDKQRNESLKIIAQQQLIREDITKSDEERIRAAEEINRVNDALALQEIALQKARIENQKANIEATQTTVEDIAELTRLEGELSQLEIDRANRQRENQNQLNAIRQRGIRQAEALAKVEQNYADEIEKRNIKQIENIDERFTAEEEFSKKRFESESQRLDDLLAKETEGSERYGELLLQRAELQGSFDLEQLELNQQYQDAKTEQAKKQQEEEDAILKKAVDDQKKIAQQRLQEEIRLQQARQQATVAIVGQTFALLTELAGENAEAQKAIAVAQTIWNTAQAITSALTAPPPLGFILAGLTGALGAVQIAKILSTNVGSGGGGGAPQVSTPSVNVPQTLPTATAQQQQLTGAFDASQQQPPKAQVVGNEVTSQQAIDRNVVANAAF